jgi:hypothetical protein
MGSGRCRGIRTRGHLARGRASWSGRAVLGSPCFRLRVQSMHCLRGQGLIMGQKRPQLQPVRCRLDLIARSIFFRARGVWGRKRGNGGGAPQEGRKKRGMKNWSNEGVKNREYASEGDMNRTLETRRRGVGFKLEEVAREREGMCRRRRREGWRSGGR